MRQNVSIRIVNRLNLNFIRAYVRIGLDNKQRIENINRARVQSYAEKSNNVSEIYEYRSSAGEGLRERFKLTHSRNLYNSDFDSLAVSQFLR